MYRWLRPQSRSFRIVLGLAFVAWTALLASAFAAPLHGPNPMAMDTATPMITMHALGEHCQGTTMRQVPMVPTGHANCCHSGCFCLAACNAVLAVPRLTVAVSLSHPASLIFAAIEPDLLAAAPPLRPPIA